MKKRFFGRAVQDGVVVCEGFEITPREHKVAISPRLEAQRLMREQAQRRMSATTRSNVAWKPIVAKVEVQNG
jgi:hypothetical protein